MKKHIIILIFIFSYVQADENCNIGELNGVTGEGIVNSSDPQQISTSDWLFHSFNSQTSHPQNVNESGNNSGVLCDVGIQVTGRDGLSLDSAFYVKEHNNPSEVRFRFILDTENLLQNFNADDAFVFYKFVMHTADGTDARFLKVTLIKRLKVNTFNEYEWEIKYQWYDDINSEIINQKLAFQLTDEFIEFEFFWNEIDSFRTDDTLKETSFQAGVITTIGIDTKPILMISPFNHASSLSGLEGKSRLGYINSNQNPAYLGDEIRIISPNLYNN